MARPPAPIDQEQRAVLDELAAIYRLVWDQYARYPDDSPMATALDAAELGGVTLPPGRGASLVLSVTA